MQLNYKNIVLDKRLEDKWTETKDLYEMYQEFLKLETFDAKIYTEESVKKGKYNGFNDVWIIVPFNEITLKIRANISHDNRTGGMEIYIKNFIPLRKKIQNGIDISFTRGTFDQLDFLLKMRDIENDINFVQKFNDTAEIIDAIRLYKEITSKMDMKSEQSFALDNFSIDYVYNIDNVIAKELKMDFIRTRNNTYVLDEDKNNVPSKHVSNEKMMLWKLKTPTKIVEDLAKTLSSIIKDGGLLPLSNKFNDWGCEKQNIKLIDFQIKKLDQNKSHLLLITSEDHSFDEDIYNLFFVVYDRLRFKKRSTMLDVVKDVENNRINNNNLFQYLFNNGAFANIGKISNWNIDSHLVEKHSFGLHDNQKVAFNMAIDEFPVAFIQGPPGTGKTHTITRICQYFDDMGMKVLVSSQTNVAVENILENLWRDNSYEGTSIKADYKSSTYSDANIRNLINDKLKQRLNISNNFDLSSVDLHQIIEMTNIVGSTTTSSALTTRMWEPFYKHADVLIVDEISKSSVPELIRYVANVKKVIFVGDQKQLAPLDEIGEYDEVWNDYSSKEKSIIQNYISVSIFDKLFEDMRSHGRAVMLNINQRSLPFITETYSYFYKNSGSQVGLISQRSEESSKIKWKESVVPYSPFTFISMNGGSEKLDSMKSRYNLPEAIAVGEILNELTEKIENTKELTVAIISFYGAQVREITNNVPINELRKHFKNIKVDTVDSFQGDQADIVILSTVRETKTLSTGFIDDFRRVNVSISRAKDLVVMLGNEFLLRDVSMKIDDAVVSYYKWLFDYLKIQDSKSNKYAKAMTFRKVG